MNAVKETVLLVGASLDQSIKQLPARHRTGTVAFSAYSRAADLGPGVLWYALLGLGTAVITIAAAGVAVGQGASSHVTLPLVIAAILSLLHSIVTTQAAPTNFSQRRVPQTEDALNVVFDLFTR
jgi:hypothetical protein